MHFNDVPAIIIITTFVGIRRWSLSLVCVFVIFSNMVRPIGRDVCESIWWWNVKSGGIDGIKELKLMAIRWQVDFRFEERARANWKGGRPKGHSTSQMTAKQETTG